MLRVVTVGWATSILFAQLIAWFLCGWYVGLVFVPIYNAFARKSR